MTAPKIEALGIVQDGSPHRWKASGHVEGVGWLETWAPSLIEAMEALERLAAKRVAEEKGEKRQTRSP